MKVKTYEAEYDLVEFNQYISHDLDKPTYVVDFVIEYDDISFIEKDFENTFIIDTDNISYIFSDYKVNEYYKISNNLIRIICVK